MSMINREVAWRIFAEEFNNATLEVGGTEERSPSYVVTPLGAMVNRVYIVGVLTETENLGSPDEPMWRGRVTDPTGTFFISAGQYQPGVATSLANLDPPTYVAVVGKARTYRPDDETILTSIRGELINEVTEEERDYWILEAAKSLKERLKALSEATQMEEVSAQELIDIGYDPKIAEGIKKASEHYESFTLQKYWTLLEDSLRYVLPEYEKKTSVEERESPEEEGEEDKELENNILALLEELEEKYDQGDGVEYDKVRERAMDEEDITEAKFEEIVSSLKGMGQIYEPALGNLKRIY